MRTLVQLCIIFLFYPASSFSQKIGKVDYKNLGISFEIPNGWFGQETQEGYIMQSQNLPGVILLNTHNYNSLEILKRESAVGMADENGTQLQLSGTVKQINSTTISAYYEGTMEWQPVTSYAIGCMNSYGEGVVMMVFASTDAFSPQHETALNSLHKSLKFYQAAIPPQVKEWEKLLSNSSLNYFESYNSGGSVGGGYSMKRKIDLCAQGYFNYSRSSLVSTGNSGISGYASGSDKGQGTWEIVMGVSLPVLRLEYYDGTVSDYTLEKENNYYYLNGEKHIRATSADGEYAPSCY